MGRNLMCRGSLIILDWEKASYSLAQPRKIDKLVLHKSISAGQYLTLKSRGGDGFAS
jgi:hypothetical protein